MKQSGELPVNDGKRPFTLNAYKYITFQSLKREVDFGLNIFGHLFFILCWNFIARCTSVASLMYDHKI
jgi:hypothetical protein